MGKRTFKLTKPELIDKFISSTRRCDDNGMIKFTNLEMLMIARATGLKSKKRRHIRKRFKLVISAALQKWLDHQQKVDNSTSL
jgi:hypothetical protein